MVCIVAVLHLLAYFLISEIKTDFADADQQVNTLSVTILPDPASKPVKEYDLRSQPSKSTQPAGKGAPSFRLDSKPKEADSKAPMTARAAQGLSKDEDQIDNAERALPDAGSLTSRALESAGKIDRELRQGVPHSATRERENMTESAWQKAFQKSGWHSSTSFEEYQSADGRKWTRVTGPSGVYCVSHRQPDSPDMPGDLPNSSNSRVTTCP